MGTHCRASPLKWMSIIKGGDTLLGISANVKLRASVSEGWGILPILPVTFRVASADVDDLLLAHHNACDGIAAKEWLQIFVLEVDLKPSTVSG